MPFDITTIPDLRILEAWDLDLANDDLVDSWESYSAYAATLTGTGGGRPVFKTNVAAGGTKPAVRFNGSSQFLTSNESTTWGDFFLCVVYKTTVTTGFQRLLDKDYTDGTWLGADTTGVSWGGGVAESSAPYGIYVAQPIDAWHIISSQRETSLHTVWGDGGTPHTSNSPGSASLSNDTMVVGRAITADNYFTGDIAAILWAPRALTTWELDNLHAVLLERYVITPAKTVASTARRISVTHAQQWRANIGVETQHQYTSDSGLTITDYSGSGSGNVSGGSVTYTTDLGKRLYRTGASVLAAWATQEVKVTTFGGADTIDRVYTGLIHTDNNQWILAWADAFTAEVGVELCVAGFLSVAAGYAIANWTMGGSANSNETDTIGSHDLTDTFGTVASVSGLLGNARDFDASLDQLIGAANTDVSAGDNAYGVYAWFRFGSVSGTPALFSKWSGGGGNREYNLFLDSAQINAYAEGPGGLVGPLVATNAGTLTTGVWYFVSFWHDPVANKIYISVHGDGVDSTPNELACSSGLYSSTSQFLLGGGTLDADVDDVTITRGRFLTADERAAVWNNGAGIAFADWDTASVPVSLYSAAATVGSGIMVKMVLCGGTDFSLGGNQQGAYATVWTSDDNGATWDRHGGGWVGDHFDMQLAATLANFRHGFALEIEHAGEGTKTITLAAPFTGDYFGYGGLQNIQSVMNDTLGHYTNAAGHPLISATLGGVNGLGDGTTNTNVTNTRVSFIAGGLLTWDPETDEWTLRAIHFFTSSGGTRTVGNTPVSYTYKLSGDYAGNWVVHASTWGEHNSGSVVLRRYIGAVTFSGVSVLALEAQAVPLTTGNEYDASNLQQDGDTVRMMYTYNPSPFRSVLIEGPDLDNLSTVYDDSGGPSHEGPRVYAYNGAARFVASSQSGMREYDEAGTVVSTPSLNVSGLQVDLPVNVQPIATPTGLFLLGMDTITVGNDPWSHGQVIRWEIGAPVMTVNELPGMGAAEELAYISA